MMGRAAILLVVLAVSTTISLGTARPFHHHGTDMVADHADHHHDTGMVADHADHVHGAGMEADHIHPTKTKRDVADIASETAKNEGDVPSVSYILTNTVFEHHTVMRFLVSLRSLLEKDLPAEFFLSQNDDTGLLLVIEPNYQYNGPSSDVQRVEEIIRRNPSKIWKNKTFISGINRSASFLSDLENQDLAPELGAAFEKFLTSFLPRHEKSPRRVRRHLSKIYDYGKSTVSSIQTGFENNVEYLSKSMSEISDWMVKFPLYKDLRAAVDPTIDEARLTLVEVISELPFINETVLLTYDNSSFFDLFNSPTETAEILYDDLTESAKIITDQLANWEETLDDTIEDVASAFTKFENKFWKKLSPITSYLGFGEDEEKKST